MVAEIGGCKAVKDDGKKCQARPQAGSEFCVFHDPAAADLVREARRTGGLNRQRPTAVLDPSAPDAPLDSIQGVVGLLGDTINQVRKGKLDPRIANAVGYLAGIMLRALEGCELERRLASLESAVQGGRPRSAGFDPGNPHLPASLARNL